MKFNRSGFTLIELLIVVAIIGIVGVIATTIKDSRYHLNHANSFGHLSEQHTGYGPVKVR